jgi:hypothetical protein
MVGDSSRKSETVFLPAFGQYGRSTTNRTAGLPSGVGSSAMGFPRRAMPEPLVPEARRVRRQSVVKGLATHAEWLKIPNVAVK